MNYHFNWRIFLEQSPTGAGAYWYLFCLGLGTTVLATVLIVVLAMTLGTPLGVMRTMPSKWANAVARTYVEVFRNIPLIVQLFLWYFVFPELLPEGASNWFKQWDAAPFVAVVLGIGCYMAARVAEQVRSGINALPRGQALAAVALGLRPFEVYRLVLLPNAFRIIWPTLTTDAMNTVKATSVGVTIGWIELTGQAHAMQEFSFQVFETFFAALACYVLVNFLIVMGMRTVEERIQIPGFGVR